MMVIQLLILLDVDIILKILKQIEVNFMLVLQEHVIIQMPSLLIMVLQQELKNLV